MVIGGDAARRVTTEVLRYPLWPTKPTNLWSPDLVRHDAHMENIIRDTEHQNVAHALPPAPGTKKQADTARQKAKM